jgi:hypothetical protein
VSGTAKKFFYLLLLGLATYGWWKFTGYIRQKIEEADRG